MPLRIVFLFPVLLLISACSGGDASPSTPATLRIEGTDGVAVELNQTPSRIVSLAPHATEVFCAIGAGELLVAVDRFENCPPGSGTKPEVDSFQPSVEAVSTFNPDFVYAFYDPGDVVASLRRLGIPVLLLDVPESLDGVFENIELIGRIAGREAEARRLVSELTQRRDVLLAGIDGVEDGPRFYHELDSTLFTVRDDTFLGELYALIKGQNIAAGAQSQYPQLSSEAVVAADPEVIVLVSGETPEAVQARPGWQGITAVQNDRICEVDGDLVSRPGPRIVEGLEALAACLYPER